MAKQELVSSLAGLTAVLGLLGCGSGSAGGPASQGPPACSDVWVVGKTLPTDYSGCREGGSDGRTSVAFLCVGRTYATFDPEARRYVIHRQYWAVLGERVHLETNGDPSDKEPGHYC